MATIARRFRGFMSPPPEEWESLDDLRRRTRETLNRPYDLKFDHTHQEGETPIDLDSIFRPFGNVVAKDTVVAKERVSWRRVLIPLLALALFLGGVVAWQYWQRTHTNLAVVSPIPSGNQSVGQNSQPVGEIVPPGTKLEPGGPYSGTGSTQPPGSGTTNLNSGGMGGTVSPQTCPSGKFCSGTALDGTQCSFQAPCTVVRPGSVVGLPAGITQVIYGPAPDGGTCSVDNPCILIHS